MMKVQTMGMLMQTVNLKTIDAYRTRAKIARERFNNSRKAEKSYARQLRQVAKQIGSIINGMTDPNFLPNESKMRAALQKYSELLNPWARSVAKKMLDEVGLRDAKAWAEYGDDLGKALRQEVLTAPTGAWLVSMLEEQVTLITSLPLKAAKRVHDLTLNGLAEGTRAADIAKEIMRTGKVTEGRAKLIARTEVARTAAGLTMARATHVGSPGYFWRTAKDADVRHSHKLMEGKYVEWDKPPTLEDGTVTHAGMIYNCRCYAEPYLPELD
jgi:SPP1 gp7 family putative phage head morphogenesis protein